jgi:hypothetical protein
VSYVYFIACTETLRVKIGFTSGSPYVRLKALQTGAPADLVLMACVPGTVETEQHYHRKYAAQRVRGEWFEGSPELLEELSMITWLTAVDAGMKGKPIEDWVRIGLETMNAEHPLPDDLAQLIQ